MSSTDTQQKVVAPVDEEVFDILVAEDDPVAQELISSIFEVAQWPAPVFASDGAEALQHLQERHWDILISDLNMPRLGGEELIRRARLLDANLTILVITGNGTIDRAVSLMRSGAFDFITKPYSVEVFLASLRKAKDRVLELGVIRGMRDVIDALLVALESKDRYLQGHASRVQDYAVEVGRLMGLPRSDLKMLEFSALLHDVGKIGIHEDILNKPGKLTDEEYEIMKTHPVVSRDILQPVAFLKPCLPAVLHHHERMDGRGYPHGIAGEEIPLGARIIAVVDTFDAMTSARSYRDAKSVNEVVEVMRQVSGTQLDPEITALFLDNLEKITGQGED